MVKASSEFCPECGATLDPSSEGSDSEVYNELAKANLLRNRHQMQEAIEVALGILRKYPNNATAHTLLGDIYAELDDLKQAAEWYEMALDLSPESASDQLKLQKVRERMAQQQAATTAKALGIPQSGTQVYIYVAVALGLLLICSIGAFMLGKNGGAPRKDAPQAPYVVPGGEGGVPDLGQKKTNGPGETGVPTKGPAVIADENALTLLQTRSALKQRVVSAVEDPRNTTLFITVKPDGDELADAAAIFAAREVFNNLTTYRHITVRVVRNGLVEFVGDAYQDVFTDAIRRLANAPTDQVVHEAFEKPWSATTTPPATTTPTTGTEGSAPTANGNGTGGAPNEGTTTGNESGAVNPGNNSLPPTTPDTSKGG
ncbi:MAG: tetratricopeptide repeat protein [Armatimonadota bacterium]